MAARLHAERGDNELRPQTSELGDLVTWTDKFAVMRMPLWRGQRVHVALAGTGGAVDDLPTVLLGKRNVYDTHVRRKGNEV